MTINDQIRDKKVQYDINRKAAEISVLSSVKVAKYEHLSGKEILASNQQQIKEQARFTYFPFGKLWKTNKNNRKSRAKTSWGLKRFKTKRTNNNQK